MSDKQTFRDFDTLTAEDIVEAIHVEIRKLKDEIKLRDELLWSADRIITAVNDGHYEVTEPGWVLGVMMWRDRYEELRNA